MEVTCWRCQAVFDPKVSGGRCPNCGHHPEAWLAKLRFAASDFIGPVFLLGLAVYHFNEAIVISAFFVICSLVWVAFIFYEDFGDWITIADAPLTKPPMPESWKGLGSVTRSTEPESPSLFGSYAKQYQGSARRRPPGLTWAEQLLMAVLLSGLIVDLFLHRSRFAQFAAHAKSSPVLMYFLVILGLIVYVVRRARFDEQVLRDGVLTTGVLVGWYDKSSYTRTGYNRYIRIRYQFWTEAGQKFEGSGTLNPGASLDNLSINQEPLKVYYLPQDPSKNVALCCTSTRI